MKLAERCQPGYILMTKKPLAKWCPSHWDPNSATVDRHVIIVANKGIIVPHRTHKTGHSILVMEIPILNKITQLHLRVRSPQLPPLWPNQIKLTNKHIIFGVYYDNNINKMVNFEILLVNWYIYRQSSLEKKVEFLSFLVLLKLKLETEKYIHCMQVQWPDKQT